MAEVPGVTVLLHRHIDNEQFPIAKFAKTFGNRSFPFADSLYLGSPKYYTRSKGVENFIFKPRPSVFDLYILLNRHRCKNKIIILARGFKDDKLRTINNSILNIHFPPCLPPIPLSTFITSTFLSFPLLVTLKSLEWSLSSKSVNFSSPINLFTSWGIVLLWPTINTVLPLVFSKNSSE